MDAEGNQDAAVPLTNTLVENIDVVDLPRQPNLLRQTRALLHKSSAINRRMYSSRWTCACCPYLLVCEMLLPMLIVLMIGYMGSLSITVHGHYRMKIQGFAHELDGRPRDSFIMGPPNPNLAGTKKRRGRVCYSNCLPWQDAVTQEIPFVGILKNLDSRGMVLRLKSSDDKVAAKIDEMIEWIDENWFPGFEKYAEACQVSSEQKCEANPVRHFAEVEFHRWDEKVFDYTIRCDVNKGAFGQMSFDTRLPDFQAYRTHYDDQINSRNHVGNGLKNNLWGTPVHEFSFPRAQNSIQLLMDRYFIKLEFRRKKKEDKVLADDRTKWATTVRQKYGRHIDAKLKAYLYEPIVSYVPVPSHGWIFYDWFSNASGLYHLLFGIWALLRQERIIISLFWERQSKLREGLKMLGVGQLPMVLSFYLFSSVYSTWVFLPVVPLASHFQVFPGANWLMLYIVLWLWDMSTVSFTYFIHCFFDSAKVGTLVSFLTLVLQVCMYYLGLRDINTPTGADIWLRRFSMFFPQIGISFAIDTLLGFSINGKTCDLRTSCTKFGGVSLCDCIIFLAFSILFWPMIGAYVDAIRPKQYGSNLPPWFMFTKTFWMGAPVTDVEATRQVNAQMHDGSEDLGIYAVCEKPAAVEEVPSHIIKRSLSTGVYVCIKNLRKTFHGVAAVKGMCMSMYQDQIIVLLGHNGAGKSTLINMITGLIRPSSGDATIVGFSIVRDMSCVRRVTGVCPQVDPLWPMLSVHMHLRTWCELQGVPGEVIKSVMADAIQRVGLNHKLRSLACDMSGGERRKLSLALALLGAPKVVILDEPSTGMDPTSRRHCWDIIRRERAKRITIITTHFMDEADVLADRIAIMHAGGLQCCGSPLFLKSRFGAGYRITFAMKQSETGETLKDALVALIRKHVAKAEVIGTPGLEVSMRLPLTSTAGFADMFDEIEENLAKFEISSYGLSMVSLEDVFVHISSGRAEVLGRTKGAGGKAVIKYNSNARNDQADEQAGPGPGDDNDIAAPRAQEVLPQFQSHLPEKAIALRQLPYIFLKRVHQSRRDFCGLAIRAFVPAAMIFSVVASDRHSAEFPTVRLNDYQTSQILDQVTTNDWKEKIHITPENTYNIEHVAKAKPGYYWGITYDDKGQPTDATNENSNATGPMSSTWLKETAPEILDSLHTMTKRPHRLESGAVIVSPSIKEALIAYRPGFSMSLLALTNKFSNMVAKRDGGYRYIITSIQPMKLDQNSFWKAKKKMFRGMMLKVTIALVLGYAILPIPILNMVKEERRKDRNVRQRQLLSGVDLTAMWIAHGIVDVLLNCIMSGIIILSLSRLYWPGMSNPCMRWTFVLVMYGYSFAIVPFCYAMSFVMPGHMAVPANMATLIATLVCTISSEIHNGVEVWATWIMRAFPFATLTMVVRSVEPWCYECPEAAVGLRNPTEQCFQHNVPPLQHAFALFITGTIWTILILAVENGWECVSGKVVLRLDRRGDKLDLDPDAYIDEDVADEAFKVATDNDDSYAVRVVRLRKVYWQTNGVTKPAVKTITFGVAPAEIFGLLGTNGSGKSTLMKIIVGEMLPTDGFAQVFGHDSCEDADIIRRRMGYCSQDDIYFDGLSCREQLYYYGRIRGAGKDEIEHICTEISEQLEFKRYLGQRPRGLSGGNKRKLALMSAMIGNVGLVMLDEPSSGIDPLCRRKMWNFILETVKSKQTAALFTTHCMEEADALCNRMAIMSAGELRCVGSSQHLKDKFSQGYSLEARLETPSADEIDHMIETWNFDCNLDRDVIDKFLEREGGTKSLQKLYPSDNEGKAIAHAVKEDYRIPAKSFVGWWITHCRFNKVLTYLTENFTEVTQPDINGRRVFFRLPVDCKLGPIFRELDSMKEKLDVEDYSLSQTTLELIFNRFAEQRNDEVSVQVDAGGDRQGLRDMFAPPAHDDDGSVELTSSKKGGEKQ